MSKAIRVLVVFVVGILSSREASAQNVRAEQGERVFADRCIACHVRPGATSGADAAPTLAAIAERAQTGDYLRGRLLAPHPPMPDFALSNPDIEGLIAYFARLRAQR